MKEAKSQAVKTFFESPLIAVAGVSRNEQKFGSLLYRELRAKGKAVAGINPHMTEIQGDPCYASVSDLPAEARSLVTVVKPENTLDLVKAAHEKGIQSIWMQQGSQSPEAVAFCREKGMSLVDKECLLMYTEPVGSIHKFHRGIWKLFGKYLK